MRVASITYGAIDDSEREVFLTAALCNDEVGYKQYAEGAGCFAPETGRPRNKFARSREALFIVVFIERGSRNGATHLFEISRRETPLSSSDAAVCPEGSEGEDEVFLV